jgi:hypothetical protein
MNITVIEIASHRNGIDGPPLHAIVFRDAEDKSSVKPGVVFDKPWHIAVFDIGKLAECDVEFGSNSYRGDRYESQLRDAVKKHLAA